MNVTHTMPIAAEEISGPVQTVTASDAEDEAADIANEPEFGLMRGIYPRDQQKAFRVARRVEAGMILINNYNRANPRNPFRRPQAQRIQPGTHHVHPARIRIPENDALPLRHRHHPTRRSVTDVYGPEGTSTER